MGGGGGVGAARGVRMMASGLDEVQLNGGDVSDADVDLEAVREFYAGFGVPWGLRVPVALAWRAGRFVRRLPLMGAERGGFRAVEAPAGVEIRAAAAGELRRVVEVDAAAFRSDPARTRPWLGAICGASAEAVTVALALRGDRALGTGYALHTDGLAGPCVYVGGVGVVPSQRRLGVGGALSSWLVQRGFERGAACAHLAADEEGAAHVYQRLGFRESPGVEIYVDC
jgi:GNAT superfamily N-acetyltransferase